MTSIQDSDSKRDNSTRFSTNHKANHSTNHSTISSLFFSTIRDITVHNKVIDEHRYSLQLRNKK